jgi:hypothetical protein
MASNWNAYLEQLLAADLTAAEQQLALALMRLTLGYRQTERRLGEELVRATAGGMDGRTFWRARQGLVAKGLLRFKSSGKGGRGHRSLYALNLHIKVRPGAGVYEEAKPPRSVQETPALERGRIGKRIGKELPAAPDSANTRKAENELRRRAFDAYIGAGGTLTLDREREALASQVTNLVRAGIDERSILAACAECGAGREFPGWINQRARALAADGGPCLYERLGRSRLTVLQLRECGCPRCEQWIDHHAAEAAGRSTK